MDPQHTARKALGLITAVVGISRGLVRSSAAVLGAATFDNVLLGAIREYLLVVHARIFVCVKGGSYAHSTTTASGTEE